MLGAGFSGFGTSIAGFGDLSTIPDVARAELIIDEGPLIGQRGDCRFIDPITQDYKYNDNGFMVGGIGIQQLVYLALLTVKGSSAVASLGQSFSNMKVIGTNFKSEVISEVQGALSELINSGKVSLENVIVSKESNMIRITIQWKDLQTGRTLTNSL